MNEQPPFPLLVVDPKGWLTVFTDNKKSQYSLLGALNTRRWSGFDSTGNRWRVASGTFRYPDAWWTRLLANTFYNPRFEAELGWEACGKYALDELRGMVCSLVDKDDDLLTQSSTTDQIKAAVQKCETFNELVRALRKLRVLR